MLPWPPTRNTIDTVAAFPSVYSVFVISFLLKGKTSLCLMIEKQGTLSILRLLGYKPLGMT